MEGCQVGNYYVVDVEQWQVVEQYVVYFVVGVQVYDFGYCYFVEVVVWCQFWCVGGVVGVEIGSDVVWMDCLFVFQVVCWVVGDQCIEVQYVFWQWFVLGFECFVLWCW